MSDKPKVAFYWCASCGGCEETVVDLDEKILDVVAAVDIVFWPVALDFKRKDVEAISSCSVVRMAPFTNAARMAVRHGLDILALEVQRHRPEARCPRRRPRRGSPRRDRPPPLRSRRRMRTSRRRPWVFAHAAISRAHLLGE